MGAYAAAIRTVERHKHPRSLLDAGSSVPGVVAACLRPPLHATRFGEGFGTLYTAEYRPAEGVAVYHWPGRAWQHSGERLRSRGVEVRLAAPVSSSFRGRGIRLPGNRDHTDTSRVFPAHERG